MFGEFLKYSLDIKSVAIFSFQKNITAKQQVKTLLS